MMMMMMMMVIEVMMMHVTILIEMGYRNITVNEKMNEWMGK